MTQTTVDRPAGQRAGRGPREPTRSRRRIKGDARMAEVLRRALWARLRRARRGAHAGRAAPGAGGSPPHELAALVAELRERGVRYGTGRGDARAPDRARACSPEMEAAGETCDDRTHEAVRRTRPVRAVVDQVWPKADPVRLVLRLLSDPELLAAAADGLLDAAEQAAIGWDRPPRGPGLGPLVAGRRGADRRGRAT